MISAGAAAQQAVPAPNTLDDIVVTAQRRSENIQNVPISVTAISGEGLAKGGITDSRQLQLAVPALSYADNAGFAQPFLRGIGSDINQPGAEPSVATFVDGVYIAGQQASIVSLLGVDRVEVLAGPQGTLYGRNASGGAINIYSLTPKNALEGRASVSYGNLNSVEGTANVSGGLTDRLAVGLYVAGTHRDSIYQYFPVAAPGQKTAQDTWGARVKAVWTPIDAITLTGSVDYTSLATGDGAYRNIQANPIGYTLGGTPTSGTYTVSSDQAENLTSHAFTAILREEADLGAARIVGITAYRNSRSTILADFDATNAPVAAAASPITSKQFSQELQILSAPSSPVSWIAGLYYFHERGAWDPLSILSGVLFPAPITASILSSGEKSTSYAAFAQATVPLVFLSDHIKLTVGGRYTRDEKEKLPSTQQLVDKAGNVLVQTNYPANIKATNSKFTPKATLAYQNDSTLLYLTYAQGYKSGLFNTSSPTDNVEVQPENLTDYEAGIKWTSADRRLRINLAGYYYDFKNLQVQVLDPSNGVSEILLNAASARAYGLDATATAAITDRFILNIGASVESSKYKSFKDAPYFILTPFGNNGALGHDATGNDLQRAPRFVATVSPSYKIPLSNGGSVELDGSFYHNSGFAWDPNRQLTQGAYQLVNASVAYHFPDGHLTVTAWVTNLTDTSHSTFEAINNFGSIATQDLPRMFGVRLAWRL